MARTEPEFNDSTQVTSPTIAVWKQSFCKVLLFGGQFYIVDCFYLFGWSVFIWECLVEMFSPAGMNTNLLGPLAAPGAGGLAASAGPGMGATGTASPLGAGGTDAFSSSAVPAN